MQKYLVFIISLLFLSVGSASAGDNELELQFGLGVAGDPYLTLYYTDGSTAEHYPGDGLSVLYGRPLWKTNNAQIVLKGGYLYSALAANELDVSSRLTGFPILVSGRLLLGEMFSVSAGVQYLINPNWVYKEGSDTLKISYNNSLGYYGEFRFDLVGLASGTDMYYYGRYTKSELDAKAVSLNGVSGNAGLIDPEPADSVAIGMGFSF